MRRRCFAPSSFVSWSRTSASLAASTALNSISAELPVLNVAQDLPGLDAVAQLDPAVLEDAHRRGPEGADAFELQLAVLDGDRRGLPDARPLGLRRRERQERGQRCEA